jgi:thiamine transport system ATP-binding protein
MTDKANPSPPAPLPRRFAYGERGENKEPFLSLQNLTQAFDGLPVLRGIDLEVGEGEIVCLLGPSGSGKTTLLRIVAGLEQADGGDVLLAGRSLDGILAHTRDFGLMFQDYALFPHMNVEQNIYFGLRMQGWSKVEQQKRLREMLELVGLTGFERRDVTQLSGGERQRVALARSLAPNPQLLMLDEPLGSLDAALRERLVVELRQTLNAVGVTALYVTHDQHEAFAVADRIAIMSNGRIEQVGTPETVYRQPRTAFVARFLGLNNVVPVLSQKDGMAHTALGDFPVSGEPKAILLHPDGLKCVLPDTPGTIRGRVIGRVFMGDVYRLEVEQERGQRLLIRQPSQDYPLPEMGDSIGLRVSPKGVVELRGNLL